MRHEQPVSAGKTSTNRASGRSEVRAPLRLAILISGGGRSLENLADEIAAGRLDASIVAVVSSTPNAGGIERCRRLGLPWFVVERKAHASDAAFGEAVFGIVREARADLVVMAGFLKLLPIPADYAGRVINIHPALLPEFGGHGMYGDRVHRAVIEAGRAESGCTVHFATDEYDRGPTILQCRCEVRPDDTAVTLAARVFALEKQALPEAIRMIQRGEAGPVRS